LCGLLGSSTPPVASRLATRSDVTPGPEFCSAKATVTVSPGSMAPFGGEKLSAAIEVAPAMLKVQLAPGSVTVIVSTRQTEPHTEMLLLLPIRQRSLTILPAAAAGRFTSVVR